MDNKATGASPSNAKPSPEDRLDSWKEIAAYLRREVRTVQRWERSAGLPVHRLQIDKSGGVCAYKSDLDAWWKERQVVLEAPEQKPSSRPVGLWIGLIGLVAALVLGSFLFLRSRNPSAGKAPMVTSLAVLPLENLTGDASQEYFSDGMTDALITQLAQLPGLRVISRTSTIHYKGTHKTVPEIARELQVDAIVEGTVTRNSDSVRITAQLINAPSDTHLWSGSVTGSPQDTLKLQGEVAQEIASKISSRVSPSLHVNLAKPATHNAEAYDSYLRGNYFYGKGNPDDTKTAIRYFQTATDKDSSFAGAYAMLAHCYTFLGNTSDMAPASAYALSRQAAEKADQLDDNLDQAHVALAINAWLADWDWSKEEAELRRAIQINPNSAFAHLGFSNLLLIQGRAKESVEELRIGRTLDPLSAQSWLVAVLNAYYRKNYDDALPQARLALELYPQTPLFHVLLSNIYAQQGQDKLAAEEMLLSEQSGGTPDRVATLKMANRAGGLKGLRLKRIELNKKLAATKSAPNSYEIAIDYAALGNKDQALTWLEKALQARDPRITLIAVEPICDVLRTEPRFAGLLQTMRLTPNHSDPRTNREQNLPNTVHYRHP